MQIYKCYKRAKVMLSSIVFFFFHFYDQLIFFSLFCECLTFDRFVVVHNKANLSVDLNGFCKGNLEH